MSVLDVEQTERIVVKLGTQIVLNTTGKLAKPRLTGLVHECANLRRQGKQILLVSSGAVGLGRNILNLQGDLTLAEKQACAAVGQNVLMDHYRQLFDFQGFVAAQVLVTASDFSDRQRYLNLRETLEKLLELGVIPIINENDTVSTMELMEETRNKSFGDNDKLSALVASKLDAQLLIILTNVDGIYTDNPLNNPDARRLELIEGFEALNSITVQGQSAYGRGGMTTKIEAARIAAISGVHTLIASGLENHPLSRIFCAKPHGGTLIRAKNPIPSRKRWVGLASGFTGVIVVNDGAKKALVEKGASLLSAGIVQVKGDFQARQVVSIQDEQGSELGRGIAEFKADEIRRVQGCRSSQMAEILGTPNCSDEVIHRDNLVIFEEIAE